MTGAVDWGLIKMQYEVFGLSKEEILEDGTVTAAQLDYAIDEQGWSRLPVCSALQTYRDLGDLNEVGTALIDEVQGRLRTLRTIKQGVLSPRYIALETAILGKALETIQVIDASQPQAAQQIKTLTDVLHSLKDQNNMVGAGGAEDGGTSGVTVNIMSKVGKSGEDAISATQVKIATKAPGTELAH